VCSDFLLRWSFEVLAANLARRNTAAPAFFLFFSAFSFQRGGWEGAGVFCPRDSHRHDHCFLAERSVLRFSPHCRWVRTLFSGSFSGVVLECFPRQWLSLTGQQKFFTRVPCGAALVLATIRRRIPGRPVPFARATRFGEWPGFCSRLLGRPPRPGRLASSPRWFFCRARPGPVLVSSAVACFRPLTPTAWLQEPCFFCLDICSFPPFVFCFFEISLFVCAVPCPVNGPLRSFFALEPGLPGAGPGVFFFSGPSSGFFAVSFSGTPIGVRVWFTFELCCPGFPPSGVFFPVVLFFALHFFFFDRSFSGLVRIFSPLFWPFDLPALTPVLQPFAIFFPPRFFFFRPGVFFLRRFSFFACTWSVPRGHVFFLCSPRWRGMSRIPAVEGRLALFFFTLRTAVLFLVCVLRCASPLTAPKDNGFVTFRLLRHLDVFPGCR